MPSKIIMPEIPVSIRCSRRGSCVAAALYCVPQLAEGQDLILQGYVSFGSGREQEHTWMQVEGVIFDPTVIQFRRFKHFSDGPNYVCVRSMRPSEYRASWLSLKSTWWRERLEFFGVPATCWAFA
jgi:hypothetical protein